MCPSQSTASRLPTALRPTARTWSTASAASSASASASACGSAGIAMRKSARTIWPAKSTSTGSRSAFATPSTDRILQLSGPTARLERAVLFPSLRLAVGALAAVRAQQADVVFGIAARVRACVLVSAEERLDAFRPGCRTLARICRTSGTVHEGIECAAPRIELRAIHGLAMSGDGDREGDGPECVQRLSPSRGAGRLEERSRERHQVTDHRDTALAVV